MNATASRHFLPPVPQAKLTPVNEATAPTSLKVHVRPARTEDVPRVAELFDQYCMFYGQPSRRRQAEAFIGDRVAKGDSAIFVAEAEEGIAGFVQLYPSISSLSMGPIWVLNDLFVSPESRVRGVGAALLDHAHRMAEETGAAHMTLATARDNRVAIDFYTRMGWQADEAYIHMYFPVKDREPPQG